MAAPSPTPPPRRRRCTSAKEMACKSRSLDSRRRNDPDGASSEQSMEDSNFPKQQEKKSRPRSAEISPKEAFLLDWRRNSIGGWGAQGQEKLSQQPGWLDGKNERCVEEEKDEGKLLKVSSGQKSHGRSDRRRSGSKSPSLKPPLPSSSPVESTKSTSSKRTLPPTPAIQTLKSMVLKAPPPLNQEPKEVFVTESQVVLTKPLDQQGSPTKEKALPSSRSLETKRPTSLSQPASVSQPVTKKPLTRSAGVPLVVKEGAESRIKKPATQGIEKASLIKTDIKQGSDAPKDIPKSSTVRKDNELDGGPPLKQETDKSHKVSNTKEDKPSPSVSKTLLPDKNINQFARASKSMLESQPVPRKRVLSVSSSEPEAALLECGLCAEPLNLPKALPGCLHTFCLDCLERHLVQIGVSDGGSLHCPTCGLLTPIPEKGGACKLPTNFHVQALKEKSQEKPKVVHEWTATVAKALAGLEQHEIDVVDELSERRRLLLALLGEHRQNMLERLDDYFDDLQMTVETEFSEQTGAVTEAMARARADLQELDDPETDLSISDKMTIVKPNNKDIPTLDITGNDESDFKQMRQQGNALTRVAKVLENVKSNIGAVVSDVMESKIKFIPNENAAPADYFGRLEEPQQNKSVATMRDKERGMVCVSKGETKTSWVAGLASGGLYALHAILALLPALIFIGFIRLLSALLNTRR